MTKYLLVAILALNAYTSYAQCTWNGGAGVWSDPTKWNCGHVPLSTDDVTITTGTVTLDINAVANNFTLSSTLAGTGDITVAGNLVLSSGSLGNSGAVSVAGAFNWTGGVIGNGSGTAVGTVTISGATTISGSGTKSLYLKTLNANAGTTYTGGAINFGYGGVFNNPAGQHFAANLASSVFWGTTSGGGVFNNAGAFEKTGTGNLTMGQAMNNTGTLTHTTATLALNGGGTHAGTFNLAAGTTFALSGTHNLSSSTLISAGSLEVTGGASTFPNNSTHVDVEVSGGIANFSGANTMQNLSLTAGTLNMNGSLAVQQLICNGTLTGTGDITVAGNLVLSGGSLGNTGAVSVAGTFSWTGGVIGNGSGTAAGTVTISGATTISGSGTKSLYLKTLNANAGTTYTGGAINFGYGGVFNNPVGQHFAANPTSNVTWGIISGSGTFNNAGAFEKTGTGNLTMGQAMNNTGTLTHTTATLALNGGGTHTGTFNLAAGTTFALSGTHNLSSATVNGTGFLEVTGGNSTFPNNSTHADVEVSGGTANFSGANTMQNLSLTSGTLNMNGSLAVQQLSCNGTLAGTGDITVAGNLVLSSGSLGNTGAVSVAGTFNWTGGVIGNGSGTAAGIVTISGATTISGSGTKSLYLKTLNANAGTTYTGGAINFGYGSVFNNPIGQHFAANPTSNVTWGIISGSGTFNNAGAFEKTGTGNLTMGQAMNNTGAISGTGTIAFNGAFNNTGLISPGASPGVLNLNRSGGLTVFDMAIELEGPAPGVGGYDQLNNTTGAVNLNSGTLTVALLNGYLPDVGTSFTIAAGTSRTGSFATLDLPVDNSRWSVTYNATNVVLTVTASLPVELIDFQVNKNQNRVRLDWTTTSEHNNRGFGVERSTDGIRFEEIGFVTGYGDSPIIRYYAFEDSDLPLSSYLYYRLRQEDADGSMVLSQVRSVKNSSPAPAVRVWPNPFSDVITLAMGHDRETTLSVGLYDQQGRFLREVFTGETTPGGVLSIPVADWLEGGGCYLLRIETTETVEYVKVFRL